jgi:menaquinone-dependent protoporphyrinogen oxidase
MNRVLVAYATMAGSTAEVAKAVGEELERSGLSVDVLPAAEVTTLEGYTAVVVGGPMIFGWHRASLAFLRRHRRALGRLPLAVFVMAWTLTGSLSEVSGVPVEVDEGLAKPPQVQGRLSVRERYASLPNYLRPILRAGRGSQPVSIGVFAGRLEYGRLPWWGVLFAMVVLRAVPADRRNWERIRSWAAGLPAALGVLPATDGSAMGSQR